MYRQLIKTTLNGDDLRARNKYAPEGVKYCNGWCQDFRPKNTFTSAQTVCNECRGKLRTAETRIKEKVFTFEEFRENPLILECIHMEIESKQTCTICHIEKPVTQFSNRKNACKACLAIKNRTRDSNIDKYVQDIEKINHNIPLLKQLIHHIPKTPLAYIISHYQIGRKSSDTKERMVNNVIEYFKKMISPDMCQNGCGVQNIPETGLCVKYNEKACTHEKKESQQGVKPSLIKMIDFEDNFDQILEELKPIEGLDEYKFNKVQIYKLAKALGANVKQIHNKTTMIGLLNEKLLERKAQKETEKVIHEEKATKQL